jgi:KipI family sensor histidine kinase inhibitor
MKWAPYGPHAWLFEFADRLGAEAFARGCAIAADLEAHPPPGLIEFVPGFTTVLLEFDPHEMPPPEELLPSLMSRFERVAKSKPPERPVKEIPVRYDGPDLARVAETNRLWVAEVCERHAAPVYRVYMLGFSPGFPYLGDLDPRLHTPRLPSPRTRVPAGSVAIGGEHTGIYTVDSPGGWNIIGHTTLKIFDPERGAPNGADEEMFLVKQGDRVKFVPVKAA